MGSAAGHIVKELARLSGCVCVRDEGKRDGGIKMRRASD